MNGERWWNFNKWNKRCQIYAANAYVTVDSFGGRFEANQASKRQKSLTRSRLLAIELIFSQSHSGDKNIMNKKRNDILNRTMKYSRTAEPVSRSFWHWNLLRKISTSWRADETKPRVGCRFKEANKSRKLAFGNKSRVRIWLPLKHFGHRFLFASM